MAELAAIYRTASECREMAAEHKARAEWKLGGLLKELDKDRDAGEGSMR